jgi:hypothetical protein
MLLDSEILLAAGMTSPPAILRVWINKRLFVLTKDHLLLPPKKSSKKQTNKNKPPHFCDNYSFSSSLAPVGFILLFINQIHRIGGIASINILGGLANFRCNAQTSRGLSVDLNHPTPRERSLVEFPL